MEPLQLTKPLVIEEDQKRALESLVMPKSLEDASQRFTDFYQTAISKKPFFSFFDTLVFAFTHIIQKPHIFQNKILLNPHALSYEAYHLFSSLEPRREIEDIIADFKRVQKRLDQRLYEAHHDPSLQKWMHIAKKLGRRSSELKRIMQYLNAPLMYAIEYTNFTNENLKVKTKRLETLANIDEDITVGYLCSPSYPNFVSKKWRGLLSIKKNKDATNDFVYDFWQQNHSAYKQLVTKFTVSEKPKPQLIQQEPTPSLPEPPEDPYIKRQRIQSNKLGKAITANNNGALFTPRMNAGISSFVEYAVSQLPQDQLLKWRKVFSDFKLSEKMKVKATALSEPQLETFFNDIDQHYIKRGNTPHAKDLYSLYQKNIQDQVIFS